MLSIINSDACDLTVNLTGSVLPRSQRTDMGIWTDLLADWARCLQAPDVEDPKSTAYRRIEALSAPLLRAMRLKV
jgi:hypothetical protein